MKIYTFVSKTRQNIYAGYGAKMWAIPLPKDRSQFKRLATKAKRVKAGDICLFYCVMDKRFYMPSIVESTPVNKSFNDQVWNGKWHFPFNIRPLRDSFISWSKDEIKDLNIIKYKDKNWNYILQVNSLSTFTPIRDLHEKEKEVLFNYFIRSEQEILV